MNPNLGSSGTNYNPNIGNPNIGNVQAEPFNYKNADDPAIRWNFQGVPGCTKCAGHGSYRSKLKLGKLKLCKKCMTAKGFCPKCNGSGYKGNDPNRPCRCGKKKNKIIPGTTGTSNLTGSSGLSGTSGYNPNITSTGIGGEKYGTGMGTTGLGSGVPGQHHLTHHPGQL